MTDCATIPRPARSEPASEPPAWAMELAETIFTDTYSYPRARALELIACRLQIVRQDGIGVGIEQAREVIRS